MADLLSDDDLARGLEGSLWKQEDGAIHRDYSFADFAEAMAFANRVAEVAEEANHHPDILVHDWNKVRLTLVTHSAGGITRADLEMAARIDGVG
jgi:4a-hydroxytetrahydrobiopterin dehydratase